MHILHKGTLAEVGFRKLIVEANSETERRCLGDGYIIVGELPDTPGPVILPSLAEREASARKAAQAQARRERQAAEQRLLDRIEREIAARNAAALTAPV